MFLNRFHYRNRFIGLIGIMTIDHDPHTKNHCITYTELLTKEQQKKDFTCP